MDALNKAACLGSVVPTSSVVFGLPLGGVDGGLGLRGGGLVFERGPLVDPTSIPPDAIRAAQELFKRNTLGIGSLELNAAGRGRGNDGATKHPVAGLFMWTDTSVPPVTVPKVKRRRSVAVRAELTAATEASQPVPDAKALHKKRRSSEKKASVHEATDPSEALVGLLDALFEAHDAAAVGGGGGEGTFSEFLGSNLVRLDAEVARLRQLRVLPSVPAAHLTRLMGVLDEEIAAVSTENAAAEDGAETLDVALQCGKIALDIMTAPGVAKETLQEDVVEHIVTLARHAMSSVVFPAFDPLKRAEAENLAGGTVGKAPRRRSSMGVVKTHVQGLFHRVCSVVGALAVLVSIERLTDELILQITSLAISAFVVDNVSALQLRCLQVLRSAFARYGSHRGLILEEIYSSLTKVPTSRRNLRTFRISEDTAIQMLTALVLQLVQSQCEAAGPDAATASASDQAAAVASAFARAHTVSTDFVVQFIKRCGTKSDDHDLRSLFENFVQDLFAISGQPEWPAAEILLTILVQKLMHLIKTKLQEKQSDNVLLFAVDNMGAIAAHLRRQWRALDGARVSLSTDDARLALLGYLAERGKEDPLYEHARVFLVSRWIYEKEAEAPSEEVDPETRSASLVALLAPAADASAERPLALAAMAALQVDGGLSGRWEQVLRHILALLRENSSPQVRSRAMKALGLVASADPDVLNQEIVRANVGNGFVDQSISVRDAAIELIGQYIAIKPEFLESYYPMLIERLRDIGVSVRRRVVTILRDICVRQPDNPHFTEICVKLLGRVNDAEGIKELVSKTLQVVWFGESLAAFKATPCLTRALQFARVIGSVPPSSLESAEALMRGFLFDDENVNRDAAQILTALCDTLIDHMLTLEAAAASAPPAAQQEKRREVVECMAAAHALCRCHPPLGVRHVGTLLPYLFTQRTEDVPLVSYAAQMLELILPIAPRQSEAFLTSLEDALWKNIVKHTPPVVQSCVKCLCVVSGSVTKNHRFLQGCLVRFTEFLDERAARIASSLPEASEKPAVLRALFAVGHMCQGFDFDAHEGSETGNGVAWMRQNFRRGSVRNSVFTTLSQYAASPDGDTRLKAIAAIGSLAVRYPSILLEEETHALYGRTFDRDTVKHQLQLLKNMQTFLVEDEMRMLRNSSSKAAEAQAVDIGGYGRHVDGGEDSGVSANMVQMFADKVLDRLIHEDIAMRQQALSVVGMILRQGLCHPGLCVPYIIAMEADPDEGLRERAYQQLAWLDDKFSTFVNQQALGGLKLAIERASTGAPPVLARLYAIMRTTRGRRRDFLKGIVQQFETATGPSTLLAGLASNLARFPYSLLDEPLFLTHTINRVIAAKWPSLQHAMKSALAESGDGAITAAFHSAYERSQPLYLLSRVRNYLQRLYGITPAHCLSFQTSEKNFEVPANPRQCPAFELGAMTLSDPKQSYKLLKQALGDDMHMPVMTMGDGDAERRMSIDGAPVVEGGEAESRPQKRRRSVGSAKPSKKRKTKRSRLASDEDMSDGEDDENFSPSRR